MNFEKPLLRPMLILVAVILVIAAGLIWRYACMDRRATAQTNGQHTAAIRHEPGVLRFAADAPQLAALRVAAAQARPLPAVAALNGRVAYDENRTARISSPVVGRVTALHADLGDTVRSGQALLDLDSPDLAASDADLSKARADEEVKQLAVERARKLFDGQVIARKDLEAAEADFHQAAAEAQRARLKLRNLHASGNENGLFELRAPIGGVITDQQVNPGLEVRSDLPNPLFTITDLGHLWVIVDVPEAAIGGIHVGQSVDIDTDAWPDRHFSGTVERIGIALDSTTRRVQVRCAVPNPDASLKPEMFARVAFVLDGQKTAIRIPNSSLVLTGVNQYVFVERSPGVFEKRKVEIVLGGPDDSYVGQGLSIGEQVVVEGALLLNAEVESDDH